jgi:hypothetical protein
VEALAPSGFMLVGASVLAPDNIPCSRLCSRRSSPPVQRRVLRYFPTHGLLDEADAHGMLSWQGSGGFSVDASVRIEGGDRAGVERLLRYCARPPFALERLYAPGGIVSLSSPESRLVYRRPTKGGVPKPAPDGRTEIVLSPIQLLERLARFIPLPRVHRHRYHGVLAPNAKLRAAITDPPVVIAILHHLELPHTPPPISPARGPPQGDFLLDQTPAFDPSEAERTEGAVPSPRVRVRPVDAPRGRRLKRLIPLPYPTASAFRPPRSAPLRIPASQSIIRLSTTTRSATSIRTTSLPLPPLPIP